MKTMNHEEHEGYEEKGNSLTFRILAWSKPTMLCLLTSLPPKFFFAFFVVDASGFQSVFICVHLRLK